jgi:hypothetical protein
MSAPLKRKFIVLLAIAAVLLVPLAAQADTTDLYFTVGNTSVDNGVIGGTNVFDITGSYYAVLHISVPDAPGGIASFTLTPGTGTFTGTYKGTNYTNAPVTFALMGTDPLGLNVGTSGSGAYLLTPTNLDFTQLPTFNPQGGISYAQPATGNAAHFDGFGDFNTAILTTDGGYATVMNQITFNSGDTDFANVAAVLAALTGNYNNNTYLGWLAVVDVAGALTQDGTINLLEGAIATGFAGNGIPPGGFVPLPPTAWLLGSGLVGLLLLGRRRKQG